EGSALVRKRIDLRGVCEQIVLGFPLANRTPYADIALLRAGEHVHVTEKGMSTRFVWRWNNVPVSPRRLDDLADEAHERFSGAVARRLGNDRATIAFLSGGLDSRAI